MEGRLAIHFRDIPYIKYMLIYLRDHETIDFMVYSDQSPEKKFVTSKMNGEVLFTTTKTRLKMMRSL